MESFILTQRECKRSDWPFPLSTRTVTPNGKYFSFGISPFKSRVWFVGGGEGGGVGREIFFFFPKLESSHRTSF